MGAQIQSDKDFGKRYRWVGCQFRSTNESTTEKSDDEHHQQQMFHRALFPNSSRDSPPYSPPQKAWFYNWKQHTLLLKNKIRNHPSARHKVSEHSILFIINIDRPSLTWSWPGGGRVALSSPQTSLALCILGAAVDIGRLVLARATDRTAVLTNMVGVDFCGGFGSWAFLGCLWAVSTHSRNDYSLRVGLTK